MQGWNVGDLISLGTGIVVCFGTLVLREEARTRNAVIQNFATGIALGPIALVIASPIGAVLGIFGIQVPDLLNIAMEQTRVTLVFSAFVSAVYLIDSMLPGDGSRRY